MMDAFLEEMRKLKEAQEADHRKRSAVKQNCLTCERMAHQPGYCTEYAASPPQEFITKENACDSWVQEIPF